MSQTPEKVLTPEEIAAYEKKTEDYLDSKLPLLRKQAEYEELLFKMKNFAYMRDVVDIKWGEHRTQQQLIKEQAASAGKGGGGQGGPN